MPFRQETVWYGTDRDFDVLVKATYGREFSLAADQELRNDSTWEANITKDEKLDNWDNEAIEQWKATGQGTFLARRLLVDMMRSASVAPGKYIIRVSW